MASDSGSGGLLDMDPERSRHPQPSYQMLIQHMPVMRTEQHGVMVARRHDIDDVFRHPEVFSSGTVAADLKNVRPLIPLQIDPPEHKKYRKILDPIFAPRNVHHMEEPVAQLVNDLIDRFVDDDEIDFTQQFSIPFPSQVFLTLLGLPLDQLPEFLRMKDGIIRPNVVVGKDLHDPDVQEYQRQAAMSIYAYFEGVLDERAREQEQGLPPRDDLINQLLHTEIDGERLTRNDILDTCFLFLTAGLDTISASLDCFFGYLAEHPEQRRQMVDDPSIVPDVVEELLRWETPVVIVSRVATRDAEIGGCPIGKGERILALLGAANVDEADFPDANEVRWDREGNRHIAFGGGIHRCLGSHLARLELRVALREWHARIPDYRVKPGAELVYSPGIRSLDTFPMQLRQSV